jgi:hypothetical protein
VVSGATTGVAGKPLFDQVYAGVKLVPKSTYDTDIAGINTTLSGKVDAAYVDAKVAGLSWKQAVRAATTAAGTLASSFEAGDTIDGVTLVAGNRILIKNQATASENGIYVVNASGAPTRATDADSGAELVNASCFVSEGTTNADTQWTCTTDAPITLGTTALAFAQLSTGGGGGGSSKQVVTFRPIDNEPPATNFATLDVRNGHPVLDFDTTTQEAAIFTGVLPPSYGGNGVAVAVYCALTTATTGTVGWDVAFERINASGLDIDADNFATAQTITATTVPGTSGQILKLSVNIANGANMGSLAAGEMFRLRVRRDVANDTAAGDAELLVVTVAEQ